MRWAGKGTDLFERQSLELGDLLHEPRLGASDLGVHGDGGGPVLLLRRHLRFLHRNNRIKKPRRNPRNTKGSGWVGVVEGREPRERSRCRPRRRRRGGRRGHRRRRCWRWASRRRTCRTSCRSRRRAWGCRSRSWRSPLPPPPSSSFTRSDPSSSSSSSSSPSQFCFYFYFLVFVRSLIIFWDGGGGAATTRGHRLAIFWMGGVEKLFDRSVERCRGLRELGESEDAVAEPKSTRRVWSTPTLLSSGTVASETSF